MYIAQIISTMDESSKIKIRIDHSLVYRGMIKNIFRSKNKDGLLDIIRKDRLKCIDVEDGIICFTVRVGG